METPRPRAKDGGIALDGDESSGYALWAMPEGASDIRGTYGTLATVIMDFSERHGTPFFDPHVTILTELGDDEIVLKERAKTLSDKVPQYPVTLDGVSHSDEYYRCVYAAVSKTPAVMSIRGLAEEIFWTKPRPYAPHFSVIYGALQPEERATIITGMNGRLDLTFTVESLRLMEIKGGPRDWRIVGEYALKR